MRNLRNPRLGVIRLEDRATPATFTVTTTQDNGNDTAPTAGSLRAAILQANTAAGADTIEFAIPGGGVQTITPTAALPAITDAVTIRGNTQTGYAGTPVIRLSGASAGSADGLRLTNHTGSTIRALTIGGFAGAGIRVTGGGTHNLFGNQIGTTANGAAADGNGTGVVISGATNVLVGGSQGLSSSNPDLNVISGNKGDGLALADGATQVVATGNFIGTAASGEVAVPNGGNGVNVSAGAVNDQIGGLATTGSGNVIAGNTGSGVRVADPATAGINIFGNRIGRSFSGLPLANGGDGVRVESAAATAPAGGVKVPGTLISILSNTISANKGNGVSVRDASRYVQLTSNQIYSNDALGIAVAPTANGGVTAPTLTATSIGIGNQVASGTLTGRPNTAYDVTLFTNSTIDPSGFGEGQNKVSVTRVTTDASGAATFKAGIPSDATGSFVAATATAVDTGETSAFSNTITIQPSKLTGQIFAVGTGSGVPQINLYDAAGNPVSLVTAFDSTFTGGVRVASGKFTADDVPDLVVGSGPGTTTRVEVIDPTTQRVLFDIQPFEASFKGGVFVAAGDVTGDGFADVIVTPDQGGGPRVRIFDGKSFTLVADFFGIDDPNFRGGARAAVGDLNGDGTGDLIVAAGFGGGPRVAAFDGKTLAGTDRRKLFGDFFVFENSLRNGAYVAGGDVNGDGKADLVAGGGPGGGPRVLILSGVGLLGNQQVPVANFFSGNTSNRGGVRVAARDLNGDGRADVLTGDGPGGQFNVGEFDASDLNSIPNPQPRVSFQAFTDSTDGVYVG